MARRMAINLGQRIATNNGSNGRQRQPHGQRPAKTKLNEDQSMLDTAQNDSTNTSNKSSTKIPSLANSVKKGLEKDLAAGLDLGLPEQESRGVKRGREVEEEDLTSVPSSVDPNVLLQTMGFDSFDTTKNKHVIGVDCYGININKKVEYRQYLQKKKRFNAEESDKQREKIKLNIKKK